MMILYHKLQKAKTAEEHRSIMYMMEMEQKVIYGYAKGLGPSLIFLFNPLPLREITYFLAGAVIEALGL